MSEEIKDEEVEEIEEQGDEEILTDEQIEVEREIEAYQSKIEALDEKLAKYRADNIADRKREAMRKEDYTDEQIKRYINHIEGETDEEIKQSVFNLMLEIPPAINYIDPTPMSGRSYRPKHKDPTELGKKAFERIKDKLRWGW